MVFIPTRDHYYDMTPTEFEKYSLEILQQQTHGLEKLEFKHNEVIKADDGSYQIDGVIRFEVMGVQYVSLVECKHYKNPITREKVQALHSPSSVCIYVLLPGCITMILFSTKNFC